MRGTGAKLEQSGAESSNKNTRGTISGERVFVCLCMCDSTLSNLTSPELASSSTHAPITITDLDRRELRHYKSEEEEEENPEAMKQQAALKQPCRWRAGL